MPSTPEPNERVALRSATAASALKLEEFVAELNKQATGVEDDDILNWAAGARAGAKFEDDVSLVELRID